jgi:hypothetical protein
MFSGSVAICSHRRRPLFFLLFPLWGILHPRGRTLMDLLPFAAPGWLCLGVIAASALRAWRPAGLEPAGPCVLASGQ